MYEKITRESGLCALPQRRACAPAQAMQHLREDMDGARTQAWQEALKRADEAQLPPRVEAPTQH